MAFKLIGTKKLPIVIGDRDCEVLTAKEFLCDTDADFEKLPPCCASSTAVSIESAKVMVVNTEGKWVVFGEPSGGGSDSIVGTWQFNDELDLATEFNCSFAFEFDGCNGFGMRRGTVGPSVPTLTYNIGISQGSGVPQEEHAYVSDNTYGISPTGWNTNKDCKTITILENPTDETFITWLKENATKIA